MAKFNVTTSTNWSFLEGEKEQGDVLTTDDVLECLRPAAMKLVDYYKQTIRRMFKRRTGSFEDSIDFEDDVTGPYAFIIVKPVGKHKGSHRTRKSRAGSPDRKYAKHNRSPSKRELTNQELGYLLEFGSPRMKQAYHWMESTNDAVGEEIQDIIEEAFTETLRKKGLID